jgi:hypothetical protein
MSAVEIDDILITDKKPYQETLRERLDKMDSKIDSAMILAAGALAILLLIASRS